MLDVAFTLVIMFLLLSTLASTTQREAQEKSLPPIDLTQVNESSSPGSTQIKSVAVTVAPGPVFYIDGQKVPFTELGSKIKQLNPPEVELRGDNAVSYGEVAKVLKALTEAGIHNVALTFKSGGN